MLTALAMPSAYDPAARGYHAVYRDGETNNCPGCGRTNWIIGRSSAECAFCATALPLDLPPSRDSRPAIFERGEGGGKVQ